MIEAVSADLVARLCPDILIKNKGFLLALADELYEKSTLLYSDVQRIRSSFAIVPCPDYSDPDDMAAVVGRPELERDWNGCDECEDDDDDFDY